MLRCVSRSRRPPIRVVLVDDEPRFRSALGDLLAGEDDISVVAVAGDGATALDVAADRKPHVVVLDLRMPGGGPSLVAELLRRSPGLGVVVLTASHDDARRRAMVAAGARCVLDKEGPPAAIPEAVRGAAGRP